MFLCENACEYHVKYYPKGFAHIVYKLKMVQYALSCLEIIWSIVYTTHNSCVLHLHSRLNMLGTLPLL